MQVVRVSGTIKKAEEEAIRRARLSIKRAQLTTSGYISRTAKTRGVALGAMQRDEAEEVEDDLGFANGIEDPDDPGDDDEGSE